MEIFGSEKGKAELKKQPLSVLYVEDNDDVREQLTRFLQRRFQDVKIATNGAEGLELYHEGVNPPDLVVSDIRMPRLDGLSMAEEIRQTRPRQPIVMTTAHEETEYLLKAIDLGVDKFILKPVNTRQLHSTLMNLAEQLYLQNELEAARLALQKSEAHYRTLFWTAMDAFCIFDWQNLEILEFNRKHQQLFGHTLKQLGKLSVTDLFSQKDPAGIRQLLEETADQQDIMLVNMQKSSGQPLPAELLVAHFYTGHQELGVLTCRDATETLASLAEQKALVEVLEMTMESLCELSSFPED
ncbi:response regulator [Marinospirillum perlucidum]|uniref:response regulator n=1 Tax=Marinospirillum perlucidum TaxID=1982602 RepID=UPI000DF1ACD3|nr:response regulator [Marinospirillum perlucidum]